MAGNRAPWFPAAAWPISRPEDRVSTPDVTASDHAAAIYSLIGSAKLIGIDPEAFLRHVIERITEYPINPNPAVAMPPEPLTLRQAQGERLLACITRGVSAGKSVCAEPVEA